MKPLLTSLFLAAGAGAAFAQSAPPWALATAFDPKTRENRFTSVTLDKGDTLVTIPAANWLRPTLTGYAQAASSIIVALGEPAAPGVPITRGLANRVGLPNESMPAERRVSLVTDDLANSMLLNVADDFDGMTLTFEGGLVNGPGPDLLYAEASLPAGRVSGGCPGVPAPGADVTVISVPGAGEATYGPDAFIDFGPAGPQLNHGNDRMGDVDFSLQTLEHLRHLEMQPLATIDYMKIYATTVDLSDLGVAEGMSVESVVLSSSGEMTKTDDGERLCWTADPILVVGLPS